MYSNKFTYWTLQGLCIFWEKHTWFTEMKNIWMLAWSVGKSLGRKAFWKKGQVCSAVQTVSLYLHCICEIHSNRYIELLIHDNCIPGICHGVAGSGYVFLTLYRLTKDPLHLYRALQFSSFLYAKEFQQARIPDSPYSLFEGLAGTVCFLADLMYPENAVFPLFNIF